MIKCEKVPYHILADNNSSRKYPYLRNENGQYETICISPIHGRSLVVKKKFNGRFVVTKGNGLTYSTHTFLYTPEMPTDVWGLLRKDDALRDFYCGLDVQQLGIKTNHMECVLELKTSIRNPGTREIMHPIILQYDVECPFRISDAGFMTKKTIFDEVQKWEKMNDRGFKQSYLIAANVLIRNLKILHDNKILHNALTCENLTWALELLDFELCHTPQHPYTKSDYVRHVPNLFDREVIDIYRQIYYIAGVLGESVDFNIIDSLFCEYGFHLTKFTL